MTDLTPDSRRLREKLAANKRRLRRQGMAADVAAVGGVVASVCDRFSLECDSPTYERLLDRINRACERAPDVVAAWDRRAGEVPLRDFIGHHALRGWCLTVGEDGSRSIAVGADAGDVPSLVEALHCACVFSMIWDTWVAGDQRWLLRVFHEGEFQLWRDLPPPGE